MHKRVIFLFEVPKFSCNFFSFPISDRTSDQLEGPFCTTQVPCCKFIAEGILIACWRIGGLYLPVQNKRVRVLPDGVFFPTFALWPHALKHVFFASRYVCIQTDVRCMCFTEAPGRVSPLLFCFCLLSVSVV